MLLGCYNSSHLTFVCRRICSYANFGYSVFEIDGSCMEYIFICCWPFTYIHEVWGITISLNDVILLNFCETYLYFSVPISNFITTIMLLIFSCFYHWYTHFFFFFISKFLLEIPNLTICLHWKGFLKLHFAADSCV